MFTGIIETIGDVAEVVHEGSNTRLKIASVLGPELQIDQSVSHDGVCLTVVEVENEFHWVVAVQETLLKSNLGRVQTGDKLNLERCMMNNGRFDGHIVQGHVDQTAIVRSVKDENGSWVYTFEYDPSAGNVTVEKGSVAINGVSLTCFDSTLSTFAVAIIPYTYAHTNFHLMKAGSVVNLEFDIIGKYVKRLLNI